MKALIGTLSALLVSGVAMADTAETKLEKQETQLKADHDKAAKATENPAAEASSGKQDPGLTLKLANKQHDAAKSDANMADASGSIGTGSVHGKMGQSTDPNAKFKLADKEHDASKSDANMADASGSIGTGSAGHVLNTSKTAHDAYKSDANMADSSGSIGTGSAGHTIKNMATHSGGQRNDGRDNDYTSSHHDGVHGSGGGMHESAHVGGARPTACHRGQQGC